MAVTILDGGIGHLLKERGAQTRLAGTALEQSFLTAAYANEDDSDAVLVVHRDYLNAGADVLTANNFAVTVGSRWRCRCCKLGQQLPDVVCCPSPVPIAGIRRVCVGTQPWSLARTGDEGKLRHLTEART